MGSSEEALPPALQMAWLVERYGWPPTVIKQQDVELFAQSEALNYFKAFEQFKRDFTALSPAQAKLVKPLQRRVERRLRKLNRKGN